MSSVLARNIDDSSLLTLVREGRLDELRDKLAQLATSEPQNARPLAQLALVALEMGAAGKAIECMDRALALQPADIPTVLTLGEALLKQRRFDQLDALCEGALKRSPEHAAIINLMGRAFNNAGKLLKAREAFERALELEPEFAEAESNLGHVMRRLGDLESARQHFAKALEIEPGNFSAQLNLATVYLEQESWAEAEKYFRVALERAPEHPLALAYLGQCLFRQEKHDEAESVLQRSLQLAPGLIEASLALGVLQKENGRFAESVETFRRVYDPARPEPYLASQFAEALHLAALDEEAVAVATELLNNTSSLTTPEAAEHFLHLAQLMRAAGRVDLAICSYQSAVRIRPAGAREHLLLAGALVQDEQEEAALDVIARALQLRPGYQSAIALQITALRRLGREGEARRLQDFDAFLCVSDITAPDSYASVDAFNEALVERVLSEPSLEFERAGHATRKGRHTDTLDIESEGPFRDLARLMSDCCARHMEALPWEDGHPFLGRRPERWRLQMWSVVMDTLGHQVPHTHDDGYLSGVYYPLLPESIGDSDQGQAGWIEFGRPMDELANKGEQEIRRIQPKTGRLAIFPSYFVHGTVPFASEQPRISIAFDLVPLAWAKTPDAAGEQPGAATADSKLAFLSRFGAHEIEHSDQDLLEHLQGVQKVLSAWGEQPALCDAGLFHSVYGTESFAGGAIPVELRGRVRQQIGAEAERLAWLFGAMRKGSFYANLERVPPYRLQSRLDDQWLEISDQEFVSLVRLTVANWFEQLPRVSASERESMRKLFLKMRPFLSERGREEFDAVYAPAT